MPCRWFCHVDDDNYVNSKGLLQLLSGFSPSQDIYVGRPSLDHPIEAAERAQGHGIASTVKFFATRGAGFRISRDLALRMSPWVSLGNFISAAEKARLPDDCTIGYITEALLQVKLLHSFHSSTHTWRTCRDCQLTPCSDRYHAQPLSYWPALRFRAHSLLSP